MDIFGTHLTASTEETQALGERLAKLVYIKKDNNRESQTTNHEPNVVCLYGELGSGKTTFSQGFARGLGLSARLLSPTFLLLRSYDLPDGFAFQHFDLYRTKNIEDIKGLGFVEIISQPTNIVLIEWAEKLGAYLPDPRIDIHFRTLEDEKHEVKLRKFPRCEAISLPR